MMATCSAEHRVFIVLIWWKQWLGGFLRSPKWKWMIISISIDPSTEIKDTILQKISWCFILMRHIFIQKSILMEIYTKNTGFLYSFSTPKATAHPWGGGGDSVCFLGSSPQQSCQVSTLQQFFHLYAIFMFNIPEPLGSRICWECLCQKMDW